MYGEQVAVSYDLHSVSSTELNLNPFCSACVSFLGSMVVSGKLSTYLSPNLTFCPKKEVSVNVRLGEG